MHFWPWPWIDSLLTLLIAIYLIANSWKILRDALKILMLFTPAKLDVELIKKTVLEYSDIQNIHHIHLWALNNNQTHLEPHLSFSQNLSLSETNAICTKLEKRVKSEFPIQHITFQAEFESACNDELISH